MGSSKLNFPSSRSFNMAAVVKLLDMEAILNSVAEEAGVLLSRLENPPLPLKMSCPSTTMPKEYPGK